MWRVKTSKFWRNACTFSFNLHKSMNFTHKIRNCKFVNKFVYLFITSWLEFSTRFSAFTQQMNYLIKRKKCFKHFLTPKRRMEKKNDKKMKLERILDSSNQPFITKFFPKHFSHFSLNIKSGLEKNLIIFVLHFIWC